jgi:hypothetical protein
MQEQSIAPVTTSAVVGSPDSGRPARLLLVLESPEPPKAEKAQVTFQDMTPAPSFQDAVATLAAVAPAGTQVVGLSGYETAEDARGVLIKELRTAASREVVAVVTPDTDPAKHLRAFDQAGLLAQRLEHVGAASFKVYQAGMPVEKLLADAPASTETLARFFASAVKLPVRKPAGKALAPAQNGAGVAGGAVVNTETLTIEIPAQQEGASPLVQLTAAARIESVREVIDDLNDPLRENVSIEYDLEVRFYTAGRPDPVTRIVPGVPDADLAKPRQWLEKLGVEGVSIAESPAQSSGKAIAAAIRREAPGMVRAQIARKRTGWLQTPEGAFAYLLHGQSITAAGDHSAHVRGVLEAGKVGVHLPDPAGFTPERVLLDGRSVWEGLQELANPAIGLVLTGSIAWSIAGMGGGGAIWLWGRPGSGKSTAARGLAGMLGESFGSATGRNIATFDCSAAAGRRITVGMHNAFTIVDDARNRQSEEEARVQATIMDDLGRIGYGGPAAGRTRMGPRGAQWETVAPDASEVAIIGVGERPITGEDSTKMRWHHVQQPDTDGFLSGSAARFEELMSAQIVSRHSAAFIMWLAGRIDEAGSMEAWQAQCAPRREKARAVLDEARGAYAHRFAEIASVFPAGLSVWLDFLAAAHAITAEERTAFEAQAMAEITESMLRNARSIAAGAPLHAQILAALRAACGSGSASVLGFTGDTDLFWGGGTRPENAQVLGRKVAGRRGAGEFVGLEPSQCLKVLRGSEFGRLTANELIAALSEVSLDRDAARKTRRIAIGSGLVAVVAVTVDAFLGREAGEGEPESAAATPAALPQAAVAAVAA